MIACATDERNPVFCIKAELKTCTIKRLHPSPKETGKEKNKKNNSLLITVPKSTAKQS